MRFHALQTDPQWERIPENRAAIAAALEEAPPSPGDFVVLPEMCETGFTMRAEHAAAEDSPAFMAGLARTHRIFLQAGIARRLEGGIANTATVFAPDGSELGCYRKVCLFSHSGEHEHYRPGERPVVIDCDGVRVAPMICYDLRFPEVFRHAALDGAEVFTYCSCWPAARLHLKHAMLAARAIENQAAVVACNRTGREPRTDYNGGSVIIDHLGSTVAGPAGDECTRISAAVDIGALRSLRSSFAVLPDARRHLLGL